MSDLSTLTGQHFAYAFGRTGVLKLLLLEQTDVDRLLGSHDLSETEKTLTELKLTNVIDQGISEGSKILQALEAWLQLEVDQMSPAARRPTFSILWLEGDAPLLSYLLKSQHGLSSPISRPPASGLTAYDPEALTALVEGNGSGSLPSHLVKCVEEVRAMEDPTPQQIDAAVSRYIARTQQAMARASGSELIRRFVSNNIDLKNIRTAVRAVKRNEDASEHLLEGGVISQKDLSGSMEDIQRAIERSPLGLHMGKNIDTVLADPIEFEQSAAHIIAADISDMWNVPMSIEPLFAFAAIAISQFRLIRTVLIAKANELSPQETKSTLPPFIPASSYIL